MIDSIGSRPNLRELGTRFDHYQELKEVFLLGIDVIDRMQQGLLSESDKLTRVKLTHAVEVINKRLDYLSDFAQETDGYSKLARDINSLPRPKPMLLSTGVPDEKPQTKNPGHPDYPENPST